MTSSESYTRVTEIKKLAPIEPKSTSPVLHKKSEQEEFTEKVNVPHDLPIGRFAAVKDKGKPTAVKESEHDNHHRKR
jgi:hypothetical protein